jgi:hypothetical protein
VLLTVLSVPRCPHAQVLIDRVRAALGARSAELALVVIDNEEGARQWGMTGSPTLLVDGVDPFAVAGLEPSVSCRLYRCAGGVPSVAELEAVIIGHRPGGQARRRPGR